MPIGGAELTTKVEVVRRALERHELGGVRLRGADWFAWATCGGSSVVLLTTDVGVAEVLITRTGAWVLADEIEEQRLTEEEVPRELPVWAHPWQSTTARDDFVRENAGDAVASDRPGAGEIALPYELSQVRWSLGTEELERYRSLGRDAAGAVTDVLREARAEWTGFELAGAASEALWARGIHPALTLVGDERRLSIHRDATASEERLGARAMLVVCARRRGLFANFTRFVSFRAPHKDELRLVADVAAIEAEALRASRPGVRLNEVLEAVTKAYASLGHPGAERLHHQGGTCGYLSRDVVARPSSTEALVANQALAWNPSLPGAKIEDTVVMNDRDVEILTVDPRWPAMTLDGRRRPEILQR